MERLKDKRTNQRLTWFLQKDNTITGLLTCVIVNTAATVLHIDKPRCLLPIRAVLDFEGKNSSNLLHKLLSFLLRTEILELHD